MELGLDFFKHLHDLGIQVSLKLNGLSALKSFQDLKFPVLVKGLIFTRAEYQAASINYSRSSGVRGTFEESRSFFEKHLNDGLSNGK